MKRLQRGAGIVMPVSALPGPYGMGDFASAVRWLSWLKSAGMRYWQILPLTIPDSVGSPFASPSSRAITPTLVSPDWLAASGLITAAELRAARHPAKRVEHRLAMRQKEHLLRLAWVAIRRPEHRRTYAQFLAWQDSAGPWLAEFGLYQALKRRHHDQPWATWSEPWRTFTRARRQLTPALERVAQFHIFAQWIAETQWQRVRRQARRDGVKIIGHLPFYVQYDSVDVWTRPELFALDRRRKMQVVSGVGPDMFSRTGQLWGTPVYRWPAHRRERWHWWVQRFVTTEQLYDVVILDHFPGLVKTWQVSARAKNAMRGRWVDSPGAEVLAALRRRAAGPLVAEDLGTLTMAAIPLREKFHIAATRVWQFAWSGIPNNIHHPDNVDATAMFFTGNHDTNTTTGWYEDDARWYEKKHFHERYGSRARPAATAVTAVMEHRAVVAMILFADLFGFGSAARINRPGTSRRNWASRILSWPSLEIARRLRALTIRTQRVR